LYRSNPSFIKLEIKLKKQARSLLQRNHRG